MTLNLTSTEKFVQMQTKSYGTRQSALYRRLMTACLLICGSTMAPASWSAVYRCIAADGTVSYSDSPCGPNAQAVDVTPQAPISNRGFASGTRQVLGPGQAKVNGTLEGVAARCATSDYTDWYNAQNPKPGRAERLAKLNEVTKACDAVILHRQMNPQRSEIAEPPQIPARKLPQPAQIHPDQRLPALPASTPGNLNDSSSGATGGN
jgi:hypothetical protein